jgi:3-phosphoshikimate 1-carboxyvinyltransferase
LIIISAPPSKSYAVRVVVAAMLAGAGGCGPAGGCGRDKNACACGDIVAATSAAEAFARGETVLDVGESALAANIFACLAALDGREITITGHGTLPLRPLNMAPLRELGVSVTGDRVPFSVRGPLVGGRVAVDGAAGSQIVTGLLMALPLAARDSVIRVENPTSIPYIYMTLDVLARFGVAIGREGWEFFVGGGQRYMPADHEVEGDWSGASCLLVAGAFSAAGVTVAGLSAASRQGDKAILDALEAAGAEVVRGEGEVTVRRGGGLRAFAFDATDCPDLFPALVALAAACDGESVLHGASRLRHKESPRGEALREEYAKIGIEVALEGDTMRIRGGVPHGARVSGHGDHRIVMSLAVSALRASGEVVIDGAQCVAKSYPQFWEDLGKIEKA